MLKNQTHKQPLGASNFAKEFPSLPGVYLMRDQNDKVLYVGKAKNLKKRVSSYANWQRQSDKNRLMLDRVKHVELVVTHSEAEALLLENNLIKEHSPRYNVLLRDDKSYPYIRVTVDDTFPRLCFYRGSRKLPGKYFGPYTNVTAVRETLNLLSRLFRLRQCRDSFFRNRTRPCLQYQIKRCSAPCVDYIDKDSYREDLNHAAQFLEGKSEVLIRTLVKKMDEAAANQMYEKASLYRDQVELLRKISEQQYVSIDRGEIDVIACVKKAMVVCVQVINIRGGLNVGSRSYYPVLPRGDQTITQASVFNAFLGQYYLDHSIPKEIIASMVPTDWQVLQSMLRKRAGHQVKLTTQPRNYKRKLLEAASKNAMYGLSMKLGSKEEMHQALKNLQDTFGLNRIPQRMECFDISHTMGEATVASCVVFGLQGGIKKDYRRFNIRGVKPGDDYAAMHQALTRRYQRLLNEGLPLPDILWIDGGKGQLCEANKVLTALGIDGVVVVGIAKGAARKAGSETLWYEKEGEMINIQLDKKTRHLVERIRDEAHRFAITGHRRRRAKKREGSVLENIPGVGPQRRSQLIKYFGGLRGIECASVDEIGKIPGVSLRLAESIYHTLHEGS